MAKEREIVVRLKVKTQDYLLDRHTGLAEAIRDFVAVWTNVESVTVENIEMPDDVEGVKKSLLCSYANHWSVSNFWKRGYTYLVLSEPKDTEFDTVIASLLNYISNRHTDIESLSFLKPYNAQLVGLLEQPNSTRYIRHAAFNRFPKDHYEFWCYGATITKLPSPLETYVSLLLWLGRMALAHLDYLPDDLYEMIERYTTTLDPKLYKLNFHTAKLLHTALSDGQYCSNDGYRRARLLLNRVNGNPSTTANRVVEILDCKEFWDSVAKQLRTELYNDMLSTLGKSV